MSEKKPSGTRGQVPPAPPAPQQTVPPTAKPWVGQVPPPPPPKKN